MINYGLGAGNQLVGQQAVAATGVHDRVTPLGTDRFRTSREETTEVSDGAVRVLTLVANVEPFELATIRDGVKCGAATGARDRGRNDRVEDILVEHNGDFVLSQFISRVDDPLGVAVRGSLHIRSDLRIDAATVGVPGHEIIDKMIKALVGTLNAERSEQIVSLGAVAIVIAVTSKVVDDVVRGLAGTDEAEHRSTVFTAKRVVASTVTDEAHTNLVKNRLNQLRGRLGSGEAAGARSHRRVRQNLVVGQAKILVTIPRLPSPRGILRKNTENIAELVFAAERETKVVNANRRRLNSSLLEIVRNELVVELDLGSRRHASSTASAVVVETNRRPRQTGVRAFGK